MSDIGKRVRALRKALGFTQVQLAKRVGVSQAAVSDIERGDTTYVLGPTLSSLAAALRTNTDWLMSGNGSAAPVIQTDDSESELLAMFRAMDPQVRSALLVVARSMYKGGDFGPTVIDQVTTDMDCYTNEIFGPVLSVLRSDSVDEAIALIHANPYGNGTAVTFYGDAGTTIIQSGLTGQVWG
jgi:transcriptional regulator with XRE-family HTH domain